MTKLIKTPFADSGDKAVIPDVDTAGNVNWSQGFPADYSKNPDTDPSAKRIERDDFNGLLNFITAAVREIQVNGVSPFITAADNGGSAFAYGKGAVVIYDKVVYMSLIDNNTAEPTVVANWARVPTSKELGGRLIGFKAFGASTTYTPSANVKMIKVTLTAGGASGGKQSTSTAAARSGGAGGTMIGFFAAPTGSINITIGQGGQAVTATNDIGRAGGDSTFGNLITAKGGTTDNGKGGGGDSTVGAFTVFGGNGSAASADGAARTFGGASFWGGGGSGGVDGPSLDAPTYGAGGAGVSSAITRSGSGAAGICVIEEYS